jgi:hypothetical protein
MRTEKLISDLVKPLIISGVYKDETTALKDIIADYIERRKEMYEQKILNLKPSMAKILKYSRKTLRTGQP